MPKHVSDSTFQLSVRVDTRALNRIDKVRDILDEQTGARPQRSDIVRKAIDYGLEVYCKRYNIDVGNVTGGTEDDASAPPPMAPVVEAPTASEPKKKAAASKKGGVGGKQART